MTHNEKIDDIRDYPENHRHDFEGLIACCMRDRAIDLSVMEAHEKYIDIGCNGGKRCDVIEGPCACDAWH